VDFDGRLRAPCTACLIRHRCCLLSQARRHHVRPGDTLCGGLTVINAHPATCAATAFPHGVLDGVYLPASVVAPDLHAASPPSVRRHQRHRAPCRSLSSHAPPHRALGPPPDNPYFGVLRRTELCGRSSCTLRHRPQQTPAEPADTAATPQAVVPKPAAPESKYIRGGSAHLRHRPQMPRPGLPVRLLVAPRRNSSPIRSP
jgi:hypothetical protein